MANKSDELKTYSFTDADIDLITFALRRWYDKTSYSTVKDDCHNLIDYIERQKEEMETP